MKRKELFYAVMASFWMLASCQGGKEAVSLQELEGEWNVVEVAEQSVEAETTPFIGFNIQHMTVYGQGGCNRIKGEFKLIEQSSRITLEQLASTRMACPDMKLEQNICQALSLTRKIQKEDADRILLCDSVNTPLAQLSRRRFTMPLSELQGDWKVVKVRSEAVPDSMEHHPHFSFDIAAKELHGNAGCNQMTAKFKTIETQPNSLEFLPASTTRMACPDIQTEFAVLMALKEVKTFNMLSNGHVGLFSSDSAILLELEKDKQ